MEPIPALSSSFSSITWSTHINSPKDSERSFATWTSSGRLHFVTSLDSAVRPRAVILMRDQMPINHTNIQTRIYTYANMSEKHTTPTPPKVHRDYSGRWVIFLSRLLFLLPISLLILYKKHVIIFLKLMNDGKKENDSLWNFFFPLPYLFHCHSTTPCITYYPTPLLQSLLGVGPK